MEEIINRARKPGTRLCRAAVNLLGDYDDPRCKEIIAEYLQTSDRDMARAAFGAFQWLHSRHADRDVIVQMDNALLATVRHGALRPGVGWQAARMIHDVGTRIKAYGDILAFPDGEDEFDRTQAVGDLQSLKTAETDVIPDLEERPSRIRRPTPGTGRRSKKR